MVSILSMLFSRSDSVYSISSAAILLHMKMEEKQDSNHWSNVYFTLHNHPEETGEAIKTSERSQGLITSRWQDS